MADGLRDPGLDDITLRVARLLVRWRQRVLPRGSRRAGVARRLAGLFSGQDDARRLRRAFLSWPEPRAVVTVWDGAAPSGQMLPDRPRIAILKLDHIGDFAVALPALRHLREGFPDATIVLVCGPWNVPLASQLGWFDRVVAFNAYDASRRIDQDGAAERATRFAALDLGRFDLAIDLRHEPDTRSLLAMVDANWRAGFQAPGHAGGGRLNLVVPDCQDGLRALGAPPLHAGVRLVALTAAITAHFGRRRSDVAGERRFGAPSVRAVRAVRAGRYVVLAPGAGAPIRRWPIDRLIELARRLLEDFAVDIVVVGGEEDQERAAALVAALPPERVVDEAGRTTLASLPGLLIGASLFVGHDTGPSHLAASLGVPTVCVFSGVGDPLVWHPLGEVVTIVAGRAGCSPCRLTDTAACPNGRACLDVIEVETVLRACGRYLDAAPTGVRGVALP